MDGCSLGIWMTRYLEDTFALHHAPPALLPDLAVAGSMKERDGGRWEAKPDLHTCANTSSPASRSPLGAGARQTGRITLASSAGILTRRRTRSPSLADGAVVRRRQPSHRFHLPREGKAVGLIRPCCDTAMQNLISADAAPGPGRHAVMLVDRAERHLSHILAVLHTTSQSACCRPSVPELTDPQLGPISRMSTRRVVPHRHHKRHSGLRPHRGEAIMIEA
jgi:hypothetical protein